MCGITGLVVPPGATPSKAILRGMNDTLRRRGPDDEGYFVDLAGGCGLGHRRLSIIDLAGGRQPLGSADGRIQAVVNGELYNFRALRAELEARGFAFATRSDSEVVVHGYRAWGLGVLERIQGMFALALWDADAERLVLARDRAGKKPLYHATLADGTFLFGSELKALLAHPDLPRELSPQGLATYLVYECLPEAATLYRGVEKLLPGEALVLDRREGRQRRHEFWRLRFGDNPMSAEVRGRSEAELAATLRDLVRTATEDRLVSDVPLGVLLSGGIDSSAVTAAMAQAVPPSSIETFSITFEDPSFDERSHARRVAAHLGTRHHEEQLSPAVMLDVLPEVADFMCEPLGDASIIPTYLLSRFARRSVTVALGGDGGDEFFLGYPTFQADRVARALDRVLSAGAQAKVGAGLLGLARLLPVSRQNFSLDFKVKRFAQGLGFAPDHRHQAWMGSFLPDELAAVLAPGLREAALDPHPYALVSALSARAGARDALDAQVFQYARLYLAGDVLVKVDRASMACGLEVRAPLLDTRIMEFAAAIPGDLRLKRMSTKYLLKEAVRPWLPAEIVDRPKKGFGVPIGEWLRGPLAALAADLLAPARLAREGLLDPGAVSGLLEAHRAGRADHRKPLWTLLALELWLERFGPGAPRLALDHREAEAAVDARLRAAG